LLYKIKHLFLATIFLFVVGFVYCQPYYFRHYQVENGLSNNAVICCLQDNKGFLWFGTKDGLDRFDGYSFKIFRADPDRAGSIGGNFIHSLYEDRNGILWIGTEKGLYQYDATTESFSLLKTNTETQVTDIRMDGSGNLWFISDFILIKYNERKKSLQYFPINKNFEATSLCVSSDGTLWASTSAGFLVRYNNAADSFTKYNVFNHSPKPVSRWIEKIYTASNGTILIGTSNQGAKAFYIPTATYKDILTYNADKTEIFVRNFVQTSTNEFWIATESGIFIYNIKTGKFTNLQKKYNDSYSISDNAVYTFCQDMEGGIWAGTYFGGVNYYPKPHTFFKKYFPKIGENSLSGNVVREIRQDNNGNFWIGTEDAGLNKLDIATGKFIHFKPTGRKGSISYSNIHGLLVNGDELWIGTFEHGLDVMNIKTGKVIRHYVSSDKNLLKSNFIYCIYQADSREIMIGTTRGIYTYDKQSNEFRPLPKIPLFNWYTSILKDRDGIIWAGTFGNGVNYLDTKTQKNGNLRYDAKNKNSLSSDRVNCIFEDSKKNLWFATEGGLCKYNRKTNDFKRYTTTNSFPSNFTISILEDEEKKLWISTTKGLVCFNPETEELNVYTKDNGLLTDQFNFSSGFKDAQGRMYFGSAKGLISFNPSEFKRNVFTPQVYITGFQVNNKDLAIAQKGSPLKKSITYTDKMILKNNQSTFSIDFAALSYTAPEMSQYAYKMEGLDKDWIYLESNRKTYFTGLPAGDYTFKVKAANSSGTWNQQETKLIIEILPPWWASRWAYGAYGLLGIIIIYYSVRSYHNRVEEKNKRKIELLESAKEKEIFQAKIEFFTNVAHEIRTPLTLIKGPLEKVIKKAQDVPEVTNSLRIMEKNTNRLIHLANQLLDFRQTEIKGFSLNFVKANISELLEETYLSFKPLAEQKNISLNIKLPGTALHAFVDTEALNKILSNLFGNAMKYADKKAQVCLLPFSKEDNFFIIEIKNDGYLIPFEMKEKIFEPFFRLKETEKQKGTGIGLALSRSLAELHKGILELKHPENNLNIFFLKLPIHQENEFNLSAPFQQKTIVTEVNNIS
jgi:ligand-binding sensor domain-containing protein/signal transduction histidine kinase